MVHIMIVYMRILTHKYTSTHSIYLYKYLELFYFKYDTDVDTLVDTYTLTHINMCVNTLNIWAHSNLLIFFEMW